MKKYLTLIDRVKIELIMKQRKNGEFPNEHAEKEYRSFLRLVNTEEGLETEVRADLASRFISMVDLVKTLQWK